MVNTRKKRPLIMREMQIKNIGRLWGLLGDSDNKESAAMQETLGLISLGQKIPWRRKCLPTPILLPGKSCGQRSLAGYSPWGHKEADMT